MQLIKHISLVVITLTVFAATAFAQRPRFRPQVHEFGLQVGSMQFLEEPGITQFTPVNGLRYAYHFNQKHALRAGVFYRAANIENPASISDRYQPYTADPKSVELRAGYMVKHHIYRLQLYAGADAIVRQSWLNESFNTDVTGAPNKSKMFGYGTSVFVGARMYANKHVSLGVEADAYAIFQDRRISDPTIAIAPHEGLFMRREMGSNMISVFLAYHFKRMHKSCTCGKPGS